MDGSAMRIRRPNDYNPVVAVALGAPTTSLFHPFSLRVGQRSGGR